MAIGTHDLDTIQGPFYYDAKKPEEIKFIPLKQTREFNAKDLLEFYLVIAYLIVVKFFLMKYFFARMMNISRHTFQSSRIVQCIQSFMTRTTSFYRCLPSSTVHYDSVEVVLIFAFFQASTVKYR